MESVVRIVRLQGSSIVPRYSHVTSFLCLKCIAAGSYRHLL